MHVGPRRVGKAWWPAFQNSQRVVESAHLLERELLYFPTGRLSTGVEVLGLAADGLLLLSINPPRDLHLPPSPSWLPSLSLFFI